MNTIEKTIKLLLEKKPFYAHFFLGSRVVYDTERVPTAAVGLEEGYSPCFYFNTKFLNTLTAPECMTLLEHETLHLLFKHVPMDKAYDNFIANIAKDLAINQYLEDLPNGAVTLQSISKLLGVQIPPNETWLAYYDLLIKHSKVLKVSGFSTLDDHSSWEGSSGDSVDSSALQEILCKAVKASAGVVPKAVQQALNNLQNKAGGLNWKQLLSNFVASSSKSITRNTRKKVNRRYGIHQAGKVRKRELVLGVCVDSSGSISNESFETFFEEINRIIPLCAAVHVVEADCVVQDIKTVKKKYTSVKRTGQGGTAYQPAISKCLEIGCDAILYFGDFDTADAPKNPGVPFLWVGVGNSPKPGDFGREVRIK